MKYDLIIFDCDGTLVDSESLINKAFSEVMLEYGYSEYTSEFCLENFSGVCNADVCKYVSQKHPELNFQEAESKYILKAKTMIPTDLCTIPNATKLLESIKDFPKCVASNGENAVVTLSLEKTGLIKFFDRKNIFTYEMVRAGKPEPDLYLYAAKQMGVDPKRCLVIEDSIVGTTAGVRAGMDVVSLVLEGNAHNYNLESEIKKLKPIAIIRDLMEVKDLLELYKFLE